MIRTFRIASWSLFLLALSVQAQTDPSKKTVKLSPKSFQKWSGSEALFVARLDEVGFTRAGLSNPPVYSTALKLTSLDVFRGKMPKGEVFRAFHVVRQQDQPTFPNGKKCLIGGKFTRGNWVINVIEEISDDELEQVKYIASLPIGWVMKEGKLYSPWASLGKNAWPSGEGVKRLSCSVTGRPVQSLGGAELKVEKVPPKKKLKYGNPDGDGEYKITVTNTTSKALSVPALISDGKTILWDEIVVIRCADKIYPIPSARGVKSKPQATTLKPGESVSTVIHLFKLKGPKWPRGGYRLEFQICVGEQSSTQSFYYLSRHHDKIREAVQGKKK